MNCPHCGIAARLWVKETREQSDGSIRRRRKCESCGRDFVTTEHLSQARLRVRKSDGRIVSFDARKVRRGIIKAAVRPHHGDRLAELVESVAQDAISSAPAEGLIESSEIAQIVLTHLKDFDVVTYARYALVQVGRRDSRLSPGGWSDADDVRAWLVTEFPELKHFRAPTRLSTVVKRDGRREPYEKRKLARSVGVASKGRLGSDERVRDLADRVADDVEGDLSDQASVTSAQIAAQILFRLRHLDHIAAIRYASTAKQFTSVEDFETEAVGLRGSQLEDTSP